MRISDWSSDVRSSDLNDERILAPKNVEVLATQVVQVIFKRRVIEFNGAPCTTHGIVKLRFLGRLGVLTNMLVEETYDIVQFHLTNGLEVRPSDRKSTRLNSSHYCAHRMPSSS